jgi:hypothetical protein
MEYKVLRLWYIDAGDSETALQMIEGKKPDFESVNPNYHVDIREGRRDAPIRHCQR